MVVHGPELVREAKEKVGETPGEETPEKNDEPDVVNPSDAGKSRSSDCT